MRGIEGFDDSTRLTSEFWMCRRQCSWEFGRL